MPHQRTSSTPGSEFEYAPNVRREGQSASLESMRSITDRIPTTRRRIVTREKAFKLYEADLDHFVSSSDIFTNILEARLIRGDDLEKVGENTKDDIKALKYCFIKQFTEQISLDNHLVLRRGTSTVYWPHVLKLLERQKAMSPTEMLELTKKSRSGSGFVSIEKLVRCISFSLYYYNLMRVSDLKIAHYTSNHEFDLLRDNVNMDRYVKEWTKRDLMK